MKRKKIILFLAAIVLLIAGFVAWKVAGPSVKAPAEKYIYIKTGSVYSDVRKTLLEKKIISSGWWFDKVSSALKYSKSVKPGRYEIKKGMSLLSLIRMLKNGRQTPVDLVIKKIRTKEDFARRIGGMFECDSAAFISYLNHIDTVAEYGLDSNTVMGVVMPDTYTYFWNSTPKIIFQKLHTAHTKFWTGERKQKAAALGITPMQAVIVASIIDEETNAPGDRPNIASVYLNRIKKGMTLGADPTIKFALKDFTLKQILNVHLKVESPYNTYINKGLPPGPICTPQPGTVDAVLNSPQTDYIFFVANSNFDGTHIFTTNLTDHEKYADLYRKEFKRRRDSVNNAQLPKP